MPLILASLVGHLAQGNSHLCLPSVRITVSCLPCLHSFFVGSGHANSSPCAHMTNTDYYWVTSMTPELILNALFAPHLPLSLSSDPLSFQKSCIYLRVQTCIQLHVCGDQRRTCRKQFSPLPRGSLYSSQHLYPLNRALSPSDQFLKYWHESLI